ncbi:MAG: hypothetical protein EOR86_13255 [Mesorhizobium sp.]|uniref:hypothetical protein n=1 Tax=Mesorhizobium sp. TaxID=1871066 RepID=UPI000FE9B284|nr:hypothetical protein [Mesorhizobium sp.]RWM96170.1 MAG: hypothetical protein EOR86_13255 [Mesorhizobium sp.]
MNSEELGNVVKPIIKGMVRSAKQNDHSDSPERWKIRFDLALPTGEKIHVSAWCDPRLEDGSCIVLLNATDDLLNEKLSASTHYGGFKEIVAKRCDIALQIWFEFYTDKKGNPVKGKAADNFATVEQYTRRR